ncbi:MAG: exo-alpha-sialidase [Pirellulales bacterium]|nr:exo-alpha-sialidase [Pirellulales bacterium]
MLLYLCLALSYGRLFRPSQGNNVVFSTDGGETWSAPKQTSTGLSSGYTDMVPLGPDRFLLVFDSVTTWAPIHEPDWVGAVDIEVKYKSKRVPHTISTSYPRYFSNASRTGAATRVGATLT